MGFPSNNSSILYLFPDTNLFIQCRSIVELPWSDLGDFDEIRLVVCRPVLREIDNQKNRGNDRVGQRARATYKIFRNIIASSLDYQVVNEGKPIVKIFLQAALLPSPELQYRLDYNKPDDEIIGCLHRFQDDNPGKDIRLLTHDGGPMMAAKSVGVSFVPIDDDWVLAPENSQKEREIARLRDRVAQLEKVEPQIQLSCVDERGEKLESLKVDHVVYSRLTEDDVATLLGLLRDRFPPAEDFGSRERKVRRVRGVVAKALGATEIYTPVPDEEIAKYLNEDYPKWIERCEDIFVALHKTLQTKELRLILSFVATNFGTRPAKDVLVQIETRGAVKVCVPLEDGEEDNEEETLASLRLPSPPRPPCGQWKLAPSSLDILSGNIPNIASALSGGLLFPQSIPRPDLAFPVGPVDSRRDPNVFYYKPSRPRDPVESFGLECEQWRHGTDEEYFEVQVSGDLAEDNIRGAVECSIHADNLSAPLKLVIPVRITVKRVSVRSRAEQLIEDLRG